MCFFRATENTEISSPCISVASRGKNVQFDPVDRVFFLTVHLTLLYLHRAFYRFHLNFAAKFYRFQRVAILNKQIDELIEKLYDSAEEGVQVVEGKQQ